MRVEDVMTKPVRTVEPGTSLKEVALLLTELGISGVPVVANGKVVGVVSEADVLVKERGLNPSLGGFVGLLFDELAETGRKLHARTAGEAMTSPAVVIGPRRPVGEAARKMLDRGVNRLPVVDKGRLVGIVTRADLVRAFVRPDSELEHELVDDVMTRTLWIDAARVDVEVDMGEVRLTGEVDTRTDAEVVAEHAARIPGVVRVESDLRWSVDDRARQTRRARIPHRLGEEGR
jgi:CBS domain-containing protein